MAVIPDQETLELARLRIDREYGVGTFGDVHERVQKGGYGVRVYEKVYRDALDRAERDIADVKAIIASVSPATNDLSTNLQRLLSQQGRSAREVSLSAGLSESAVKHMLRGTSQSPRYDSIRAIATALGVTVNDLVPDRCS